MYVKSFILIKDNLKLFLLTYFIHLSYIFFIFMFLVGSTKLSFLLNLFDIEYSLLYTYETESLTCYDLVLKVVTLWYTPIRVLIMLYVFYVLITIAIAYKSLQKALLH